MRLLKIRMAVLGCLTVSSLNAPSEPQKPPASCDSDQPGTLTLHFGEEGCLITFEAEDVRPDLARLLRGREAIALGNGAILVAPWIYNTIGAEGNEISWETLKTIGEFFVNVGIPTKDNSDRQDQALRDKSLNDQHGKTNNSPKESPFLPDGRPKSGGPH